MYIRNAIQKTGKNITFQVVEPSKESDCQVAFVLAYVGSPEWAARVSKGSGRLTAADLGDRPSCGDAHYPLVFHIDNRNNPRRRSEAALEARKAKRKDKMKEQRSAAKKHTKSHRNDAGAGAYKFVRLASRCDISPSSISRGSVLWWLKKIAAKHRYHLENNIPRNEFGLKLA